jgi:hypothetical protein
MGEVFRGIRITRWEEWPYYSLLLALIMELCFFFCCCCTISFRKKEIKYNKECVCSDDMKENDEAP